ncbi:MAG: hypothetical protein HC788_02450 [Sphingopyxis sp.]|nr:hypothetical protein [Sphingopyxis sp.]
MAGGGDDLSLLRGRGMGQATPLAAQSPAPPLPDAPVGEAPPPEPTVESQVEAVPEGQGVLTQPGRLVIDTSYEYTSSSTNRLVFSWV